MKELCESIVIEVGKSRRRVEDVPHELCEDCGERIFSIDVSRHFDALFLGKRKGAA